MYNADDNDFPINGGKTKLAKLFEDEPPSAVSLKYVPHKQPPPLKKKPTQAPPLKVLISAAVVGFELIDGSYTDYGLVGVALLGSESKDQFVLYLYDSRKKMLASIDIEPGFQFTIHENNYASFRDLMSRAWSLRFSQTSDLDNFCKRLVICKWLLSDRKETLIQEAIKGSPSFTAKAKDTVTAIYVAQTVSAQGLLGEPLPSHCVSLPANSTSWISPLVGCCPNSKTLIILPKTFQADWCPDLPPYEGLMVEITVQKITPFTEPDEKVEKVPSDLIARMSKIGTALPTVMSSSSVESAKIEEKKVTDDVSANSLPSVPPSTSINQTAALSSTVISAPQQPVPIHPDPTTSPSAPQMIPTYPQPVFSIPSSIPAPQPVNLHQTPFMAPSHMIAPPIDHSLFVQVNMLLSEVRTNNSELRMNLMRVADKVDVLSSKVSIAISEDKKPSEEPDPVRQHSQSSLVKEEDLIKLNNECDRLKEENALLKSKINVIEKSSKALEEHLNTKEAQFDCLKKDYDKKESERLELLCSFQNTSEELEKYSKTISSLEKQINSLQSKTEQLDAENLSLLKKVSLMTAENMNLGKQYRTAQKENALLKEEMKAGAKQRRAEKTQKSDIDLPAIIRRVINLSYKALSSELNSSLLTHESIAETLRCVASDFIENLDNNSQVKKKEVQQIKEKISSNKEESDPTISPFKTESQPPPPSSPISPTFESAKLSEVLGEKESPTNENNLCVDDQSTSQVDMNEDTSDTKPVESILSSDNLSKEGNVQKPSEAACSTSTGLIVTELESQGDEVVCSPLTLQPASEEKTFENCAQILSVEDKMTEFQDENQEPIDLSQPPPLPVDVSCGDSKNSISNGPTADILPSSIQIPLLKPEPPPFSISPSSSPPKHEELEQIHLIQEKPSSRKSSLDSPWRTEPPPLFESDDDEWLSES